MSRVVLISNYLVEPSTHIKLYGNPLTSRSVFSDSCIKRRQFNTAIIIQFNWQICKVNKVHWSITRWGLIWKLAWGQTFWHSSLIAVHESESFLYLIHIPHMRVYTNDYNIHNSNSEVTNIVAIIRMTATMFSWTQMRMHTVQVYSWTITP